MYDEMTRQWDHYWASLAYAQEEGRTPGLKLGIEQGYWISKRTRTKYVGFSNQIRLYFPKVATEKLYISVNKLNFNFSSYIVNFIKNTEYSKSPRFIWERIDVVVYWYLNLLYEKFLDIE